MRAKIFTVLAIIGALYSFYLFYLEHFVGICFTGYCSEYPALLGFLWFAFAPLTLRLNKIKKTLASFRNLRNLLSRFHRNISSRYMPVFFVRSRARFNPSTG